MERSQFCERGWIIGGIRLRRRDSETRRSARSFERLRARGLEKNYVAGGAAMLFYDSTDSGSNCSMYENEHSARHVIECYFGRGHCVDSAPRDVSPSYNHRKAEVHTWLAWQEHPHLYSNCRHAELRRGRTVPELSHEAPG